MKSVIIYISIFVAGVATSFFYMKHGGKNHEYTAMDNSHHGVQSESQNFKVNNHKHDEVNMPGLQGKDTTDQEVNDLKEIFRSHKGIIRVVSNLENGIVTTTEAENEILKEAIVSHVTMMVTRLQEGKNPEVMIQSPTLDALFDVYEEIDTEIELTDMGIKVIQTSTNPEVIKLLQKHAAEVSDMSKRGMVAVHERMMKKN
jgi:hypothetical protein